MDVVTISSAPSRTPPLGISSVYSAARSPALRRRHLSFVAFKSSDTNSPKTLTKSKKQAKRSQLDYSEVAEALENLYKLSPAPLSDLELDSKVGGRKRSKESGEGVVRNGKRRARRLSLDGRIALRRLKEEGVRDDGGEEEEGELDVGKLLREFSGSIELGSLEWRKMKIPPVLSLGEHDWLFRLMQPLKVKYILHVKDLFFFLEIRCW